MTETEIRLECLRLAASLSVPDPIKTATNMVAFVSQIPCASRHHPSELRQDNARKA